MEPDPMRKVVHQTLPVMRVGSDEIVGEADLFVYEDTGYGAVVINNATMVALGATPGARFFPGIAPKGFVNEQNPSDGKSTLARTIDHPGFSG